MMLNFSSDMVSAIEKIVASRSPGAMPTVSRLTSGIASRAERQEIIDLVAAELCQKGFDKQCEPTRYGLELEQLIDILNRPNIA